MLVWLISRNYGTAVKGQENGIFYLTIINEITTLSFDIP